MRNRPIAHINKILSICRPSLVLVEKLRKDIKYNQLEISSIKPNIYDEKKWKIKRKNDGIAYIIFTSGSTGDQKGVIISKKAYKSYISWVKKYFEDFKENKKLLITAELTFDITLGTESMSNTTGNVCLVRFKLESGDSITALSIGTV